MRPIRILAHLGAFAALLLVGCPKSLPTRRVDDKVLLADAQTLGDRLQRAGVKRPVRLIEAYLAHFRGLTEERDRAICDWLSHSQLTPTAGAARLSSIKPPSKGRMRAFLAVLLTPRTCRAARPSAGASGQMRQGVYSFSETKTSLSGDTLTVQERWVIRLKEDHLWGWYLRRLDRQSGDGRPYQCNKKVRYGLLMAFTFKGELTGSRNSLVETDAFVQPGPCAPKQVRLDRCRIEPLEAGLVLRCPEERTLNRIDEIPLPGMAGGVYAWSSTTPRPDGGKQRVAERWHLVDQGGKLFGFYTRDTQATARAPGTFKCNGAAQYRLGRLYLIGGTHKLGAVTLSELAALHRPHPCDDGRVKLDTYRGKLAAGTITLSWGEGQQKLERSRITANLAMPIGWVPKVSGSPPGR